LSTGFFKKLNFFSACLPCGLTPALNRYPAAELCPAQLCSVWIALLHLFALCVVMLLI